MSAPPPQTPAADRAPPPGTPWLDAATLLVGNVLLLGLALWQNWSPGALLWPYWMQSMLLGIGQTVRISRLSRRYDGDIGGGILFTAQLVPHLLFLGLLLVLYPLQHMQEGRWIWIGALFLLASQTVDTYRRIQRDAATEPSIDQVARSFKLRFLAMHFMILFGLGVAGIFASPNSAHANAPYLLVMGAIKLVTDVLGLRAERSIDAFAVAKARDSERRRRFRLALPTRRWPFSLKEKKVQDDQLAATMPPPPDEDGLPSVRQWPFDLATKTQQDEAMLQADTAKNGAPDDA
ncbi:DUF6498-containing protein [Luteimonas aquatica]|uniref:DUF6498-containing protein n=1 Tax=Luteimonas aquatica TaxID=450364 RepID=UPI001F594CC4|nr:DUF6498-containing protein [Luteimonas aquatica]